MKIRNYIVLISMVLMFIVLAICTNNHTISGAIKKNEVHDLGQICINEVCSSYFPTSFLETQPDSDWIELYNTSNEKINLGEYYLSDDKSELQKYHLPSVDLLPNSYYVIHSETEEMIVEGIEGLTFRISSAGETVYLSNNEGVIDIVNVPAMDTNTSWSRLIDAGLEWGNTELTYQSSNNESEQITEKIEAPEFSVESGFYENEFELELAADEKSKIYYTLDGSDPDSGSILYENPILIKDESEAPNIYASRNDFAPLQNGIEGPVEKIVIVRAIAIDENGRKSNIVTNSYMVEKESSMYKEMYTVSLVTDPYNLFDYEEGIYVLGKEYDDFIAGGGSLDDVMQASGNYRIRGKRSERPASLEIFDSSGNCVLDREVGVRIHGGTTRGCVQKSFSVYAREMYDGSDTIEGLFGEDTTIHKFFIYTNREGTKLRDTLISEMIAERDVAVQSFIYCNVFLDGEYWGIYLLAEVYDEYYFNNHYGIGMDNIQIHEGANPSEILEYLSSIPDKSDAKVYEELCEKIDVQSFIDYYAAMLYLNNSDWLSYNARCYRSIDKGPGINEDGKWRWGVWDIETAMYNVYEDTFHMGNVSSWEKDPLAQILMEHEEFRKQFVLTYMDLYNNIWNAERILPIISNKKDAISASYTNHYERFYGEGDVNQYIAKLEGFFEQRAAHALEHIREEFQLNSSPAWLVILTNQEKAAEFRVNTSVIDLPASWWQGLYFPDYPVEIEMVEEYDDNVFLGWYTENDELISTDKTVEILLKEGTNIIYPKFLVE